jgi:transcriptional regulator with XRE-family HTH domain
MTSATRGIGKSVHSPDQAAFCELMIGARKAAGLTQHALARRLKKPQSFVAKYEGGERRVDVVEFITIAPRPRRGPTQVDDDPFERRKGQIPTRQAGHLTSIEIPKRTVQRSQ